MYKKLTATMGLALISNVATAMNGTWEVTITNLTQAQLFTPLVAIAHESPYRLFRVGQPASDGLELMAEGGNTSMLEEEASGSASSMDNHNDLLGPGQSVTLTVTGNVRRTRISLAGMLIPTNDTFVAMDAVTPPRRGSSMHLLQAWDSGTEVNDQSCQHIPGPRCGGEGFSVEGGEGHVHISNGFHDLGDTDQDGFEVLGPVRYDWRNPVARVRVQRIR